MCYIYPEHLLDVYPEARELFESFTSLQASDATWYRAPEHLTFLAITNSPYRVTRLHLADGIQNGEWHSEWSIRDLDASAMREGFEARAKADRFHTAMFKDGPDLRKEDVAQYQELHEHWRNLLLKALQT